MKNFLLIFSLLFIVSCSTDQPTVGVKFEQLSFDETLAKANKENKLIMVDLFSDGWGGCVEVDQLVFQSATYGEYINKHFISLRLHAKKDEGKKLREKWEVRGFPTVLFFNSKGEEIDRICGFNKNKVETYFQTIQDFVNGKNTMLALTMQLAKGPDNVSVNYNLAKKHIDRWEGKKAYNYVLKVLELDPGDENRFKSDCIFWKALYAAWYEKNAEPLQTFMDNSPDKKYFDEGYSTLINLYKRNKNNEKAAQAYEVKLEKLGETSGLLNDYAWFIYENKLKNKYELGIKLATKAVELAPKKANIWDTLSWLQFENGDLENALKSMKIAVDLEPDNDGFKKNLKKMEEKAI